MWRRSITEVLFLILMVLLTPVAARAYLDPGTGSYLFQILVGLLFGAAVGIKVFWREIKEKMRRIFGRGGTDKEEE